MLSKKIVQAAILSLTMAVYSVFLREFWIAWLTSQNLAIGFGEEALGYFFAIMLSFGVTWIVTRNMRAKE